MYVVKKKKKLYYFIYPWGKGIFIIVVADKGYENTDTQNTHKTLVTLMVLPSE